MKQIKKTVVALLCVCMLFAVGCGTKENANIYKKKFLMHHNTQKGRVQMKQIKKTVVALLCVCMLFAVGCGTKENANNNGNTTTNTDKKNTDGDGVMEDVGRGIDNGVRDVVDGVEDTVDDVTENNRNNHNTNNSTTTK